MNKKIVRTPGQVSNRRERKERKKIDHEQKDSTNTWIGVEQKREKREIMNIKREGTTGTMKRRDVERE